MKNLFTLLCSLYIIALNAQNSVTFKVDMAGQTISPNGVHLAGNFQSWNPAATLMSNTSGTIYQVTVPNIASGVIEYKFVNGNSWCCAEAIPASCAQNGNRFTNITATTTLPTVAWEQCPPPPTYSVTFKVDMAGQTISPNGVHLFGSFQGWNPSATPMTNTSGTIYEVTVPDIPAGTIEYKFINGNVSNNAEGVPAACAQNFNRFATISSNTSIPTVCYGLCTTCPPIYNVTFRVNMVGQTISPNGVHLAGNFQGWNPSSTLMTNLGNGVWEKTLPVLSATIEYKFINGNAWVNEETVPATCAQNTNRFAAISAATTLPTVCFGSCTNCPPAFNVTFRVDMTGQTVSAAGVHLAGSFQNWNPGSTVMTNVGGGIWEKTMLVFQSNAEYKFINGNAWGDEEIVPAACAQNTNRFTNVTAVTTLPVVCFSKCTPCSNLAVSATNTTNVSCNGGNNGSITVTSTGNAGCTPTYNWSNGQTSTTISNLAAGTYTVTATCGTQTATYTTTITQPSAIAFGTPMIQNVTCSAAGSITVNATGGTGTIFYLWVHNNSNTPIISVSTAGTYTVSAKDANNCTTTLNVTVTGSGNIPTVQITNQNPAIGCATPSIVLNATSSASNVSYNWTGQGITSGGNSANVTVNATGTYTVVVTNPNSCTASTSIVVSTSGTGTPSFSIQGNTSICQGDSTVLSSSGSFSSYLWSNGATTSSIKVKTPNTYTLTVTDANGCVGSNSATVSIKPTATATLPTKDTLTCTKTTIVLNVITPLTNPNVSWTGPNGYTSTNLTPTITEPGVYNLVIGSATACSNSYSTTIYQNTGNQTVSITGGGTFCNKSSTLLSVPPNLGTYLWSNSVTTNSITATQSGTYTVSVTSPNGCKQVKSAMVKISPTFAVNAGEDTKACENKSLILSANSAADNLAYAWTGANNFSYNQKDTTIATVKPSHAGDYFVVATDANGCKATDTIKVLVSPKIDIQLLASVNCKDSANIISQITGGVPNFTYAWSCNSDVTPTTTAIAPIIVTLTVTDSYGCIETSNPALAIDGSFLILLTGSVSAVSNNGKGSISVTATNAAAPIKYLWSNGATTKDLAEIEKGQYCVTVTDGNGCTATECFDVKSTATTSTTDNSIANVIAVYPNPTFDVINIDTKGNLVLTRIELFDINGKILQTHEGDTKQITTESLPNAIYLLKCSTKDGFAIKKIVKQD